jgi:hypothetical protein
MEVDKFFEEIDSNKPGSGLKPKGEYKELDGSVPKIKELMIMKAPSIERKMQLNGISPRKSDMDSIAFLEDFAIDKIIAEEHLQP